MYFFLEKSWKKTAQEVNKRQTALSIRRRLPLQQVRRFTTGAREYPVTTKNLQVTFDLFSHLLDLFSHLLTKPLNAVFVEARVLPYNRYEFGEGVQVLHA